MASWPVFKSVTVWSLSLCVLLQEVVAYLTSLMQGSFADVEGEKDPPEPEDVELSDSWYQECVIEEVTACSRCLFGASDVLKSKSVPWFFVTLKLLSLQLSCAI